MLPVKKQNRVPSFFDDVFGERWSDVWLKRVTTPQVNVIETDKKFKVEIAAPGMSKDDLKIDLTPDNQLVVSLERDEKMDDKTCDTECDKHYLRREFSYTNFRQVFSLPESVDRDKITAKMKHGVLRIKLPKREGAETPAQCKRIDIE